MLLLVGNSDMFYASAVRQVRLAGGDIPWYCFQPVRSFVCSAYQT